uniref:Centrosomal protein of 70 kDa n=1 Tax=Taeniopygia guttata TaxID=59729 RepID=H0Z0D2_TAEGU
PTRAAPRPEQRPHSCPAARAMIEQEKAEWENLNRILMCHGLKPVSLAAPQNMIVLDHQSSQEIRLALQMLVEDTERQQKVMQGLMEANRCLRDVVQLEQGPASRQEQRANDLENVVKNIKAKICQLEDETIAKACQQQNQVKELQKEQQVKYQQQQEKLQEQEEIIARLQKELRRVGREEQQRVDTQNKMFCQFCRRAPKSLLDQRKLNQFIFPNRQYKKDEDEVQREVKNKEDFLKSRCYSNYKALLMVWNFQEQVNTFQCKTYNVVLFLSSRPTAQELKFYKHQVKKLQKALKKTIQKDVPAEGDKQLSLEFDQELSINIPSPAKCKNYIKEDGQGCGFEHLPLTIEMWADQLIALKVLEKNCLWNCCLGTLKIPQDNKESIRVEDLQLIVDAVLEELEHKEKVIFTRDSPCKPLSAIVSHFQKLFDVNSLNGLGQMTNAMRNLYELLELGKDLTTCCLFTPIPKKGDRNSREAEEENNRVIDFFSTNNSLRKKITQPRM